MYRGYKIIWEKPFCYKIMWERITVDKGYPSIESCKTTIDRMIEKEQAAG